MKLRLALVLVGGLLFGFGLALGGMTDPGRVIGFLDVTGDWDPALLFVMGGALGTFAAVAAWSRRREGGRTWWGGRFPVRDRDPVDRRLVAGALIFGVGWGLSGFCPGPALANLVAWRVEALVFVPAMVIGMLLARAGFGADRQ